MNIVCIGGGTGLSSTVKAWTKLEINPSAVVATTDNGGCSGRLRHAGSPIPWGDIRKVLVAMSSNTSLTKTLGQRYEELGRLTGHCFGNLMLEALYQQNGDVLLAINALGDLLGVTNRVFPMADNPVDLMAINKNGALVYGEENVDSMADMPMTMLLDRPAHAPTEAVQAIKNADVLCLGPGSLITSVLPPLLVPEIKNAVKAHQGLKLLIHNCQPEASPVSVLDAKKQFKWLEGQVGEGIVNGQLMKDHVIIDGVTYSLATHAQQLKWTKEPKHDISRLSLALALSLCISDAYHYKLKHTKALSNLSRVLFDSSQEHCV
ncbi:uridine diphosphate-N-acetylglucosamine-binding protein YvcK [Alteromonas sp. KUL49]|uniref:gluconeogenesis factor YvcK family protein n=1 Tax=Alteromonas sp. KUL49 TaxID=2480798 RepID=UPI00102EDEC5|nr:uridine diphosphate-N-acetylglucosamine-binding protein YvcK [Alteromonas sp. KUL49]TAP40784.1 uridine diphosphate-N-acetylglucosamine-binding protein YvcK [Alteromonas sp. KUL49]GEA10957.1 putative gluconeogenesis factor [Alteromonas sp. KUL49]